MEVEWYVYHQDGSNPTDPEFNTILAENWGWFDVKHDYVLKRVEKNYNGISGAFDGGRYSSSLEIPHNGA